MEFLEKLAFPQTNEHIILLQYLIVLVMILFIPFISLLIGGSALSIYFRRKAYNENNLIFLKFAKSIIEITSVSKTAGVTLGVIPIFVLMLIFAQLLKGTNASTNYFLFWSFVSLLIGVISVYIYRYSFSFKNILENISDLIKENEVRLNSDVINDVSNFKVNVNILYIKSAWRGLVFLLIATYLFCAGLSIAVNPTLWNDLNKFIFLISSWQVFIKWLFLIAFAFIITGAFLLFHIFYWEDYEDDFIDNFKVFIQPVIFRIVLISGITIPLLIFLNILTLPPVALSNNYFYLILIGLFLLFLALNFVYSFNKNWAKSFSGLSFYVIMLSCLFFILADQSAILSATKKQTAMLSLESEKLFAKDIGTVSDIAGISGVEIFKTRCSACHKFDQKLVGPAYKQTLVKYEGNIEKLIEYIKNPVKIDPVYPPMPNPGLKPNEARAVAKFILEEVKKY